jgi:hypothetical protein
VQEYGLSALPWDEDPGTSYDEAKARFARRRDAVLNSPYFRQLPDDSQKELAEVIRGADIFWDLWGAAEDVFDRAEASLHL